MAAADNSSLDSFSYYFTRGKIQPKYIQQKIFAIWISNKPVLVFLNLVTIFCVIWNLEIATSRNLKSYLHTKIQNLSFCFINLSIIQYLRRFKILLNFKAFTVDFRIHHTYYRRTKFLTWTIFDIEFKNPTKILVWSNRFKNIWISRVRLKFGISNDFGIKVISIPISRIHSKLFIFIDVTR